MIEISGHKLYLNFDKQYSKKGRPMRLSGISLVTTKPAIWIDKVLIHGTIYIFRYLDKDEFIGFEFNPQNKFTNLVEV